MSALGLGKSRHPSVAGGAATLTLHFAMKISRATCAKKNHVERVSTQGRMFGLRISAGLYADDLPTRLHRIGSDWLSQAFAARRWFGLMRYRSATVAESHGLPRCLG